jgi:hypothetical protein
MCGLSALHNGESGTLAEDNCGFWDSVNKTAPWRPDRGGTTTPVSTLGGAAARRS